VIRRLDHVALRVADVAEASERWRLQFGLTERAPGVLSCDDEPRALELIAGDEPGFDHVAYELTGSLDDAAARLGVPFTRFDDRIELADVEGNAIHRLH
jgi:catechol 2,3-dioxygenase-like lactoylglutathione lyase family enzyme